MSTWKLNATSTSRACPARSKNLLSALPTLILFLPLVGCANIDFDASLDRGFKAVFTPRRSPQQYMLVAVSSEDPDQRRDAAAHVAKSNIYDQEWAIKGFIAIATLESDTQTRCVAIRALARTNDPRAVEAALKILNYQDHPAREVWPPEDLCRWDATLALRELSQRGVVPPGLRDQVRQTLCEQLATGTNRHVRIAAAGGLAYYPNRDSVDALVAALSDRDFAVIHECEKSLVHLTGHTHDCDALAWKNWVAENEDRLFADAGYVPESRRPPYEGRWGKFVYDTRDLVNFLWPGAKE